MCKAQWGGPQSHSPPRGNRSQPQGSFTYLWHMQVLHQPPAGQPSTTCQQGVVPLSASTRRATWAAALRAVETMRTTVNASRPPPRPPCLAPMCKVAHQLNERSEYVCNQRCTSKGSSSVARAQAVWLPGCVGFIQLETQLHRSRRTIKGPNQPQLQPVHDDASASASATVCLCQRMWRCATACQCRV